MPPYDADLAHGAENWFWDGNHEVRAEFLADVVEGFVEAFEEAYEGRLKGLLFTVESGSLNDRLRAPSLGAFTSQWAWVNYYEIGLPLLTLPLSIFEDALVRARLAGNFEGIRDHRGGFAEFSGIYAYSGLEGESAPIVYAVKKSTGEPDVVIVVVAHIDGVLDGVGANDNASGVAALLALAKHFKDIDLGGVELWFAAVGAEEYYDIGGEWGWIIGTEYFIDNILPPGREAKTMAVSLDMLASPSWYSDDSWGVPGNPLNVVSLYSDSRTPFFHQSNHLEYGEFTLLLFPHLVIRAALQGGVTLAPGVYDVRVYENFGSDHDAFLFRGMEAFGFMITTDHDDNLEFGYHSAMDNLSDNYSWERLNMSYLLVRDAIQLAVDTGFSRRAVFIENEGTLTLLNAPRLFNTYDIAIGVVLEGGTELLFSENETVLDFPDGLGSENIVSVFGKGNGFINLTTTYVFVTELAAEFMSVVHRTP